MKLSPSCGTRLRPLTVTHCQLKPRAVCATIESLQSLVTQIVVIIDQSAYIVVFLRIGCLPR